MSDATQKKPRLGKARKRGKLAIKSGKKLLKKHGNKIDPAKTAEVQGALDALIEANQGKDVVAIYEAIQSLDDYSELHLSTFRKSPMREYIESIGWAVGIALLLRAFVVEAFTIPSGSMIPTLAVGDFLFVNKLSYGVRMPFTNNLVTQWSDPERGDVIVFVYPCDDSYDYIKRVVGLPGDVINVDRRFGFVTINGEMVAEQPMGVFAGHGDMLGSEKLAAASRVPGQKIVVSPAYRYRVKLDSTEFATQRYAEVEPYVQPSDRAPDEWANSELKRSCVPNTMPPQSFPWKVPEGHVFVMGDNRQNSQDSRYWGFVPFGAIKGKAMFIWLSWDGSKPWSRFWEKIRWGRLFGGVHAAPE